MEAPAALGIFAAMIVVCLFMCYMIYRLYVPIPLQEGESDQP